MPDILSPLKWTPKQVAVIRLLAQEGTPLYGAEIADGLGWNRGHVYPILHRLHRSGLVVRVEGTDVAPKRLFYGLTPNGRAEAKARCGTGEK